MASRSRSPVANRRQRSRSPRGGNETNKLYIGNLSWNTNDASIREAFSRFGDIEDAFISTDRETGRSRGFGFVTFVNAADAAEAKRAMDGADLDGRQIRLDFAQPKGEGNDRGGGRGGFRGGRGRGGFRGGDRDGGFRGGRGGFRGGRGRDRDSGYDRRDRGLLS